VKVEQAEQHAEPAELDDDILAFAEFGDAGLPHCEGFLFLVRIRADAERSADMVQDECGLREGARQIRQLHPQSRRHSTAISASSRGIWRTRAPLVTLR
jgi:hypothetical protein